MDGMSEEERYEGTLFPFAYIMTLENRLQDQRNRRKQRKVIVLALPLAPPFPEASNNQWAQTSGLALASLSETENRA